MNLIAIARRHPVKAIILVAVGAIVGWWLLWQIASAGYRDVIDGWIEKGRAEGYEITYDRREQFGFPSRAVLRFVNLHWKNADGIDFHAGDIDISASLWESREFNAKFKGRVEIDAPLGDGQDALVIGGESGEAEVALANDGTWEHCRIAMQAARLGRSPNYLLVANAVKFAADRPARQPRNHKEAGLTLSGEADDIVLPTAMPPSFGPKMPKLKVDLRVMGAVPDFRRKVSVAAWNKDFGVVEFDRLDMEWGQLLLASKGTMGFDDDLQPEGAFAAIIGHQDQVLEALMKGGFIAKNQETMLSSAMRLFSKPSPIKDTAGVEVPVAVQLGGLFLGPVKIFSFPQIEWE
jgi:hypothetical protein